MAKGLVHLNVIVLKCVPSWYAFQGKDKRAVRDDSGDTQTAKANCLTLKFCLKPELPQPQPPAARMIHLGGSGLRIQFSFS